MQVGNLLHKWNVDNDQACNKLPTSFQLVRLVGCGLYDTLRHDALFTYLNKSCCVSIVDISAYFTPHT